MTKRKATTLSEAGEALGAAFDELRFAVREALMPSKMDKIYQAHRRWSDATFGTRAEKGPIGSLKHMHVEVDEAIADPKDALEFADLQFLLWDAAYRAGHSRLDIEKACEAKLKILLQRTYEKVPDGEPSFHLKSTSEVTGWCTDMAMAPRDDRLVLVRGHWCSTIDAPSSEEKTFLARYLPNENRHNVSFNSFEWLVQGPCYYEVRCNPTAFCQIDLSQETQTPNISDGGV